MGIFRKSDPIASIESELSDLGRRAERLQARLSESERELATAERTRRDLLLDDGDNDVGAVERATGAVQAVQLRLAGFSDALGEVTEQHADARPTRFYRWPTN